MQEMTAAFRHRRHSLAAQQSESAQGAIFQTAPLPHQPACGDRLLTGLHDACGFPRQAEGAGDSSMADMDLSAFS
jgi:hypothetical protein